MLHSPTHTIIVSSPTAKFKGDSMYLMYLRKSRQDRDFADEPIMNTLQRHKARLEEYCFQHDIIVPEENILYEVSSADSIASRPMMMKLLSLVETGKYEGVLCVDMDRLSRGSGADQALVINTFKYSHTLIITPNKTYDFSNDMDEQFAELGLFMAKSEYRQIKKRLRQGKVDAVKEGKYPSANAPYGYETYKLKGQKGFSLKIVTEEATIVKEMFQWYVEENLGGHAIAKRLNDEGRLNRQGRPWLAAHVNKILRDPTYTGKVRFAHRISTYVMREGKQVKVERNNDENQLICDGLHEPIISQDLFKSAEWVRETHFQPRVRKSFAQQNPFSGVLKCAVCGKGMCMRSFDGVGKALYCPTPGCPTKGTYVDRVENKLLNWMDGWLEHYRMMPKETHEDDIREKERAAENIRKEHKRESAKQNRIYSLLEDGVYSADEYKTRMLESKKRIADIEARLSALEEELAVLKSEDASAVAPVVQTVVERYTSLSPKEKNELLKGLFHHITIAKTTGGKGHANEFTLDVYPYFPHDPE